VYECSHLRSVGRKISKILGWPRDSIYTVSAQTRNINIEVSSLLLDTTSTEN